MTEIGNEKAEEEDPPDSPIVGRAQNKSFIQREDKVHVRKLRQNDTLAGRDAKSSCGSWVREPHVLSLLEMRIVSTNSGRHRLDVEEKEGIKQRKRRDR